MKSVQIKKRKEKEIVNTNYKIIYTRKTDPDTWFIKCICEKREQAEKYLQILTDVSDIYAELKIEPVTVHKII